MNKQLAISPVVLRRLLRCLKLNTFGVWSKDGQCLFLEGLSLGLFGYTEPYSQYDGKHYSEFIPPSRQEVFKNLLDRIIGGELVHISYPVSFAQIEFHGYPLMEDGVITHALIYTTDVTAEREREKILSKKGTVDSLTMLPRRSLLETHTQNLIRLQIPFTILFIDLDGFKAVNDTWGHAKGDELLKEVAGKLQMSIRSVDITIRMGGDEFVVVLTDPVSPYEVAARILNNVKDVTTPYSAGASMGVAIYPTDGTTLQKLLDAADNRMYRMKRTLR